jgi:hypothetical protein
MSEVSEATAPTIAEAAQFGDDRVLIYRWSKGRWRVRLSKQAGNKHARGKRNKETEKKDEEIPE